MRTFIVFVALVGACDDSSPVGIDPREAADDKADGLTAFPDVRCETPPSLAKGSWRHFSSRLVSLEAVEHRGIDLVAPASAGSQRLSGEISYGVIDKALEDEDVDLFACRAGSWRALGRARTDDEGRFSLTLGGSARLPVGMRDLWVSVVGDRSGARFVAIVGPATTHLFISDVDGTLTSSENAFPESLIGGSVGAHPNAADALSTLRSRGQLPVYLTSRGRKFTQKTRDWLDAQGFPRGALRLAPSLVTLPGSSTVDYKASAMEELPLPIIAGIGNRATDQEAYSRVGLDGADIYLELAEYADEVQALVDSGAAVGFESYSELIPVFASY